MIAMDNVSQDHGVVVKNTTIKTFQEIIFYLLTLNCMSFMLCKPPFSLSSLISTTLQKLSEIVKPYKDVMVCFHPPLFIAPYMYLFTKSDGGWRSGCGKMTRVCERRSELCLSRYSSDSIESENAEINRCEDDGFRNLLSDKERRLLGRPKNDIKAVLKRNRKQNTPHQILENDASPDVLKNVEEGEVLQKSRDWSIKNRYQDDKLSIQKARDEMIRKKFEYQKLCGNQIRLLGKKFLEKSLQQGMEIQYQLAIADRILSNMESPKPALANSIQSEKMNFSISVIQ